MFYKIKEQANQVSFKASSEQVAFVCTIVLCNGKYDIEREDGVECKSTKVATMGINADGYIESFLGTTMLLFIKANIEQVVACFASFSYFTIAERKGKSIVPASTYEEAQKRTTVNDLVAVAHKLAEYFKSI